MLRPGVSASRAAVRGTDSERGRQGRLIPQTLATGLRQLVRWTPWY